nr:MAG TPA: hypothetical protein [Caudoviricetes sp.]
MPNQATARAARGIFIRRGYEEITGNRKAL